MPITITSDQVTDDVTHFFYAAGLSGFPGFSVFFAQIGAPEGTSLGTSVGGLQAICPSSPALSERSLVLGIDISALVWLAGSAGLRPASYGHRLAKKAIQGPLEPVEQRRQGRPSAHFPGSARPDPEDVSGQSDVGTTAELKD